MFEFAQLIVLIALLIYTVFINQPLWGIVVAILILCLVVGDKHSKQG